MTTGLPQAARPRREQWPGGAVDVVAAFGKPPEAVPHPLFRLFYLVEIRHRQFLQRQSRIRSGCLMLVQI